MKKTNQQYMINYSLILMNSKNAKAVKMCIHAGLAKRVHVIYMIYCSQFFFVPTDTNILCSIFKHRPKNYDVIILLFYHFGYIVLVIK